MDQLHNNKTQFSNHQKFLAIILLDKQLDPAANPMVLLKQSQVPGTPDMRYELITTPKVKGSLLEDVK